MSIRIFHRIFDAGLVTSVRKLMDEMGIAPDPDDDVDFRLQVPPHAVSNVRWNASSHALIKLIGQLSNAPSNTMLLVQLNVPSNFPLDDSSNVPSSVPPNWQPTITQIFDLFHRMVVKLFHRMFN